MSLKNEAQSAFEDTKTVYREYIDGMSRKRMGKEFYKDTDRLKQLYEEAVWSDEHQQHGHQMAEHQKWLRLFSALTQRLNPTRRLLFGLSLVAFVSHYLLAIVGMNRFIIFYELLLPFAFVSMLLLLLIELLEKTDIKHEIDLAREIQLSLLPSTQHITEDLEICSFATTAKEVGGDYVDLIETPGGTYKIIADVSGKGLKAALYMVRIQALVHLLVKKNQPSPKELFLELNEFVKSHIKDQTFITACAAFFPADKDKMIFARAGHNTPIFYSKERDSTFKLRSNGFGLGMTSSAKLERYLEEKEFYFKKGDSVLFYTDGLTEARNEWDEEYGIDRLDSLLNVYGSLHAQTIINKVHSSLENFIGDVPPFDDITFTCVHHPE